MLKTNKNEEIWVCMNSARHCLFQWRWRASKRLVTNQAIAWKSKRLLPIDFPFIQAIASCLRPSDCFSIHSIALCRLRILEFHIIDCFTVHFIALFMMLSVIPSACNTRVNKGLRNAWITCATHIYDKDGVCSNKLCPDKRQNSVRLIMYDNRNKERWEDKTWITHALAVIMLSRVVLWDDWLAT